MQLTDLEQEYFTGEPRQVLTNTGNHKTQWVNCRRVELNALSADPHKFVRYVESKLEEHACAKKLVPPKKAIEKHARDQRDSILRMHVREVIDHYLDLETIVRSIAHALKRRIDIKGIPDDLEKWANDLPAEHWERHVSSVITKSVRDIEDTIRHKVGESLREVLAP